MKSRKKATTLKNSKVSYSGSQKSIISSSYPVHQPHELANKFSSIKKIIMMCLVQEISLLVISEMRIKQACAETSCCLKKSAVSEVDPCGGVEKNPTRIRYEINKYIL